MAQIDTRDGDGGFPDPSQGNSSPVEMEAPGASFPPQPSNTAPAGISQKAVDDVIHSDIGITVLLNRLKQSISSARDFASFLRHRATIEETHSRELRKISKTTYDAVRRPESRQGSYALQLADVTRGHERMADNGQQFANALRQMHDDLNDLTNNMERGRKQWKQDGLNAEKRVKDAEVVAEKAKARYDQLAETYERARTGESAGSKFTVKGPKSAEKREEELHGKLQGADTEYAAKVQAAQAARQEHVSTTRPQAVRAMQELIRETDAALTMQLQKFAAFNERLVVGNGLVLNPIQDSNNPGAGAPSMREMMARIDNERDFQTFVTNHSSQVPPKSAEMKYEKNPSLGPTQQQPVTQPQSQTAANLAPKAPGYSGPNLQTQTTPSYTPSTQPQQAQPPPQFAVAQPQPQALPQSYTQTAPQPTSPSLPGSRGGAPGSPSASGFTPQGSMPDNRPFRGPSPQYGMSQGPSNGSYGGGAGPPGYSTYGGPPPNAGGPPAFASQGLAPNGASRTKGQTPPPLRPVFGKSLDELFNRDDTAVPLVVYQCMQAVDSFGLEAEGIYRVSGNKDNIQALKAAFDHDSARVDFRNPESFHHDIHSVAGLLKEFLRDLPDPLMTGAQYRNFIEAARHDDENVRRDLIHAIVNDLPDPNYATLRALVLHLNRVQDRAQVNRMNSANLAICFAPTIMGQHSGAMVDAGLQARVFDTILQNTYQLFDED